MTQRLSATCPAASAHGTGTGSRRASAARPPPPCTPATLPASRGLAVSRPRVTRRHPRLPRAVEKELPEVSADPVAEADIEEKNNVLGGFRLPHLGDLQQLVGTSNKQEAEHHVTPKLLLARAMQRAKRITDMSKHAEHQAEVAAAAESYTPSLATKMMAMEAELALEIKAAQKTDLGKCMEVPLRVQDIRVPGRAPFHAGHASHDHGTDYKPDGSGEEILLQGFNWDSHRQDWYGVLRGQAREFKEAGFSMIWMPPPTDSVSPEGYMPRDLYNLNSNYGSEHQLRECVAVLREHEIKVIGDAVLNHRCAEFQDERGIWNKFGGKMDWDARAIVQDDPHFHGRGHHSTGDYFHAAPNIDHQQQFVRDDISEWLRWLRHDIGIDGWRLDFARGFDGRFVGEYMSASSPEFAVGEYWDSLAYNSSGIPEHNQNAHRQRIINWINAAGGRATAFDVTTKGILHAVFERNEYWRLADDDGKPPGVMGWWPSRSTTFLENHDTGSSQGHWRFPEHGLEQGYAYLLTHPGTPTVFYDHYFQHNLKEHIQALMSLRRKYRIGSRSSVQIHVAEGNVYGAEIDDKLVVKLGPGNWSPNQFQGTNSTKWNRIASGNNWCVWVSENATSLTMPHHHHSC